MGTPVTITWHDTRAYTDVFNNSYNARVYVNSTPSSDRFNGYSFYFNWSPSNHSSVTRTGNNGNYTYTVTVNATENMVVDICIGNSSDYSNFTFAGTEPSRSVMANAVSAGGKEKKSAPSLSLPSATDGLRAGDDAGDGSGSDGAGDAEVLSSEALSTLLATYTKKEDLLPGQDNVTYIEKVALNPSNTDDPYTVTVTEDDSWHWEKDDLPRFDENGNEYTYYVVETSPTTGYETTYLGQSEGLHDGGTATIINRLQPVTLTIVKVDENDMTTPLPGAEFTLQELNPAGTGTYKDGSSPVVSDVTGSDGTTSFEGLEEGYYEVRETAVPDGYIITDSGTFYLHVSEGSATLLTKDASKVVTEWSVKTTGSDDKLQLNGQTVTVGNEPGAQLPAAGGAGTALFYALGGVLLLVGSAFLARRRLA